MLLARTLPRALTLTLTLLLLAVGCTRQKPAYRNPELSVDQRVRDLVSRMTLEEKISQMVHPAKAVKRLGIPAYNWWGEALHGVARAGVATVFPQSIGLAATWDTDLMFRVATVISDEARAKHHEFVRHGLRGQYQGLTFWSPNINIFRDPRWGRGMETYGEDPFLTGSLAVEFVKGMQGDDPHYLKVVATPKHFAVHSGPEPDRHTFNAVVDDHDLWATYLPAFEMSVRWARAYSVMCAYNRFRGDACCGSRFLLTDVLRGTWGFEGYVVSDCGAIRNIWKTHKIVKTGPEAAALAVKAGTDLNCGSQYDSLKQAVKLGLLTEAEIDTAVTRLFRARFRLGMFDPPDRVPYASIPFEANNTPEHAALALEAAHKSIVLLKNDRSLLPLPKNLKRLAVIGPNADDEIALLGNYHGVPSDPVTLLRGIREKLPSARVSFALGPDFAQNMPAFEVVPATALSPDTASATHGLRAEYFAKPDLKGKPKLTRVDSVIDFNWLLNPPTEKFADGVFSARWRGWLQAPHSGTYYLGAYGFRGFRIVFADSELVKFDGRTNPRLQYKELTLEAGKWYPITVEYNGIKRHTQQRPSLQLLWSRPAALREREALAAARNADVVVLALGLSPRLEGEERRIDIPGFKGGDRTDLGLPKPQELFLEKVVGLGKPVVLVLFNGSALAVDWASQHVHAIVEAWYPGQAGGQAVADVLFGDVNPGGRLPVTFYKSVDQIPDFTDYGMAGRTYRYFRGQPLFPFGYGLSYTRFRYGKPEVPPTLGIGDSLRVRVQVQNVGRRDGDEVVQIYAHNPRAREIRWLVAYKRVHLKAGEKRNVQLTISPWALAYVNADGKRVLEPGRLGLSVGGKQPGFHGLADAWTTEVHQVTTTLVGPQIHFE